MDSNRRDRTVAARKPDAPGWPTARRPGQRRATPVGTSGHEDTLMSRKTERPLFGGNGRKWRAEWERRRLRNRVIRALTMAPRGGVAGDGSLSPKMSLSLNVEWYARDLHPWDSDLPVDRRAELFAAG